MRRVSHLFSLGALTAACLCTQGVRADWVAFQDDFEDEAVGTVLGPPQVGTWSDDSTASPPANPGPGIQVTDSPAFGTRAVAVRRQDGYTGNLKGFSLPGTLVPGNTIEVKWSSNVENAHRFNGPVQIQLGHVGAGFGGVPLTRQLAFIQISDVNAPPLGGGGAYGYYIGPGHFSGGLHHSVGDDPNTRVRSSVNTPGANEGRWDHVRAILNLTSAGATGLSGTMSVYVDSADDALGEIQIADNVLLETTDFTGVADSSVLQLQIAKGVSSGITFYDNISVTVVPEPTMGLAAAGLGMLLIRRTRK